jgi:hypothetical protein
MVRCRPKKEARKKSQGGKGEEDNAARGDLKKRTQFVITSVAQGRGGRSEEKLDQPPSGLEKTNPI